MTPGEPPTFAEMEDRLYGADLDEFVKERTAAAKDLQARGLHILGAELEGQYWVAIILSVPFRLTGQGRPQRLKRSQQMKSAIAAKQNA